MNQEEHRMKNEQRDFLNLRFMPAVIGFLECSWITGLQVDCLVFLEKVRHLEALANPPPGAQRYFLTSYLLALARDQKWLSKAIKLYRESNKRRNEARKQSEPSETNQRIYPGNSNTRFRAKKTNGTEYGEHNYPQ